jgi:NADH:ubiquinone reductase (non-electrogenic)
MAKKDALNSKVYALEAQKGSVGPEEQKAIEGELDATSKNLAKVKLRPFQYSHQGSLA